MRGGDLAVGGQELDVALEHVARLERLHQPAHLAPGRDRLGAHQRDGERLAGVVGQDEARDLIGHLPQEHVAVLASQLARPLRRLEADLDVDLEVGRVDAARVVDRVGVEPHARSRRLDPPQLGQPEIGALADHAGAHLAARDADRVVGAVADLAVRFARRADIGADAAEPEEVGLHLQDRAHHLVGGRAVALELEEVAHLRRERDRLELAREDAAARRDQALVIVLPGRAAHLEEALPLGEGGGGIGVGVDEDVAVVERGEEPDGRHVDHAVAEDVARHVADADDREGLVDVDIGLGEMPLDRFPRAPRGDAHRLVVVTGRAAGREGVVEPIAVRLADRVGGVGEGGGALVGRDDEIGVVPVVAHDVLGVHDRVAVEVVGDAEHARDEALVGGDPRLQISLAAHGAIGVARHEAALGADGHDDRVLDLLRLGEAQHLGAEVLRAVRPADAAARHLAAAEVHGINGPVRGDRPRRRAGAAAARSAAARRS